MDTYGHEWIDVGLDVCRRFLDSCWNTGRIARSLVRSLYTHPWNEFSGKITVIFCTDINPLALEAARETGLKHGVNLQVIRTDLVSSLYKRLQGKIDILLFNPPYVITGPEEVGSVSIEAAWAGGVDGRQVTDQLLPLVSVGDLVHKLLFINTHCYVESPFTKRSLLPRHNQGKSPSGDSRLDGKVVRTLEHNSSQKKGRDWRALYFTIFQR